MIYSHDGKTLKLGTHLRSLVYHPGDVRVFHVVFVLDVAQILLTSVKMSKSSEKWQFLACCIS